MNVTPEDVKLWEGIDKDVREEVIGLIEMCRDSSEMNDDTHPKNMQFRNALTAATSILEGLGG